LSTCQIKTTNGRIFKTLSKGFIDKVIFPGVAYDYAAGGKRMVSRTFWKIGVRNRKWLSLNLVKFVSDKKRKKWLSFIEKRFAQLS
jgi:NAD(P)H dehydrogenase (quinone)